MPLFHIIILALVQGITEFLPVSSSGHLVLVHNLIDGNGGGGDICWESDRTLDVAVHVGTLLSVLLYYHKDVFSMASGLFKPKSGGFQMGLMVVIGSIPVIIAGFLVNMMEPAFICMVEVMAWMMLIFGVVLWVADRFFDDSRQVDDLGIKDALIIGVSQILALVPGTSRSGITMISARILGFKRVEAARFSMLLAIVAISGAGVLTGLGMLKEDGGLDIGLDVVIAVVFSFFSSLAAIALMIKWLERATFTPFAIYRVILGVVLLIGIYGGFF